MRIGTYEVLGEIGRGGAGTVYRARSREGTEVALKLLLTRSGKGDQLARFDRERRLLSSVGSGEGFVPLVDAGDAPEGPYLVMPLVRGGTLRDRLRGPLGVDETLELGRALAAALGRAHERGIVHRDLKPENVLYDDRGRPLVADLGLAKHFIRDSAASMSISLAGDLRGTFGYAAPEQLRDAKSARPSADVFSLGAILYECLAGAAAFPGATIPEVAEKLESGTFERLADLRPDAPRWLVSVIERALSVDPADRFPDGYALERALAGAATRTRPYAIAGAIAVVVVGAIGLAVFAVGSEEPVAAPTPTPSRTPTARATSSAADLAERGARKLESHGTKGAVADFSRAIELDPKNVRALCGRALARLTSREYVGAISDASRAIEADPRVALAFAIRASARSHVGEGEQAVADVTRALEIDPKLAFGWAVQAYFLLGKDYDGAQKAAAKAIELDPTVSLGWVALASAKAGKGDHEGSLADFAKAIELAPEAPDSWLNRGFVRAKLGDLDGALADYTKAVELGPGLADTWGNRGSIRSRKGDVEGAFKDLTRAIELEPRVETYWSNRGMVRDLLGDRDGAIADCTKALELAPGAPIIWMVRGRAKCKKGDFAGSIADYSRAIELEPALGAAFAGRAGTRALAGDEQGATADFRRVLELEPQNGEDVPDAQGWLSKHR